MVHDWSLRGLLPRRVPGATIAAALAAVIACGGAAASERERAPPAKLAPLRTIVDDARARVPGRVLRTRLEHGEGGRGSRWIYEVKILTADGRVVELEYDAVTGAALGRVHGPRIGSN